MSSSSLGGTTTQYIYNSASQRVRKVSQTATDYSYGLPELAMDNWPMGLYSTDSTEVIYLPTAAGPLPIAADVKQGSTQSLYAVHTDHLNTPRRLTNPRGDTVWQWVITGFGEMPATTAANGFVPPGDAMLSPIAGANNQALAQVDFALRYPGQVMDSETGLFYNHHRYYDPYLTVGYTQADPIGIGLPMWGGNPLSFSDWSGLISDQAVNNIFDRYHNRFPGWNSEGKWKWKWETMDTDGFYNPITGKIVLNMKLKDAECLSKNDYMDALDIIFHEGLHKLTPSSVFWGSFIFGRSEELHEAIYRTSWFYTGRREPNGLMSFYEKMWSLLTKLEFDKMYFSYREAECMCGR